MALTTCRSEVVVVSRKKIGGQKNFYISSVSQGLRLNGEYLLNKTRHRQSGKGVGKYEGSPTLSENLDFGPQTD